MLTSAPFSGHLRAATTQAHGDAEASGYMTAVMAGDVDRAGYAALVVQLQQIYAALDGAAAHHRAHPQFGPFFDPRLDRGEALRRDLAVLGDHGHDVTAATVSYVARLREVNGDPLLVLAHHYTRYLGDLSGGRAIAARLHQHLGLTAEQGLAFYTFDVGPAPAFKSAYRRRLDDLDLPDADRQRLVAEVGIAYRHNCAVLDDLADAL